MLGTLNRLRIASSAVPPMARAFSEIVLQDRGFPRGSMSPIFRRRLTGVPGLISPRITPFRLALTG